MQCHIAPRCVHPLVSHIRAGIARCGHLKSKIDIKGGTVAHYIPPLAPWSGGKSNLLVLDGARAFGLSEFTLERAKLNGRYVWTYCNSVQVGEQTIDRALQP